MNTVTINDTERVPVNRLAKIITTPQDKYHYKAPIKVAASQIWWDAPPPMYNRPPKIFFATNLIGSRRGMMVIIGYYGKGAQHTSKWVARCDCGKYVLRNGKVWRKGLAKGTDDMCEFCRHTFRMRGK